MAAELARRRDHPDGGPPPGARALSLASTPPTSTLEVAVLPGLGHWWMLQDLVAGAAVLRSFWVTLD